MGRRPKNKAPIAVEVATREARIAAHAAFDRLWQAKMRRDGCTKGVARRAGYRWLASQLYMDPAYCHIS
ncbi:conserved protein of unknown function (plasmid) [Rhodovastum atsumiense]|uniref:Transposase n=1 Tax=Rhodovastum atsumiense TaxID=504468 RepID=A0A5M6ITR5_9PROT|nr:zinc-finger-containing protein [Rhodovastum atsumiense]KAA5611611.1 hypothetical protein F1189_13700 [Rhodovastum atsumiense]CAH2606303.1 conserved protein of unknown function [Rhodovastum atsumiense]